MNITDKQALQIAELKKNNENTNSEQIYTPKKLTETLSTEQNKIYAFTSDKTYMFYGESEDITEAINALVDTKVNEILSNAGYVTQEELETAVLNRQKLKSTTYVDVTFSTGTTTYTAPADGYLCVKSIVSNKTSNYYAYIEANGTRYALGGYGYFYGGGEIYLNKGDTATLYMTSNVTIDSSRFYYTK